MAKVSVSHQVRYSLINRAACYGAAYNPVAGTHRVTSAARTVLNDVHGDSPVWLTWDAAYSSASMGCCELFHSAAMMLHMCATSGAGRNKVIFSSIQIIFFL